MKPYLPVTLPPKNLDYEKIISLVGQANAELARYDGLLQAVMNPEILLSPLTTQEAVVSSKIEGTQATLDEVLKHEATIELPDESKRQDVQEIVNYRKTLKIAEHELRQRPLSLFLIRQMHRELMNSVRGADKRPGQFRKIQNWIGEPGSPIDRAIFVPPEPAVMRDHLLLFEKYVQSEDSDVLIQTANVHAQFELLHPFLDGNGRIGRLLIPLFLFYKRRLSRPMFYLSSYMEKRRDEYYYRLLAISEQNDWEGWIQFFLKAVKAQAEENGTKIKRILDLYLQMRDIIMERTRSRYAHQLLDAIFDKPIFRSIDVQKKSTIPKQSLMPMLKLLQQEKTIITLRQARGRMPAVFAFPQLLGIVEGKPVKF